MVNIAIVDDEKEFSNFCEKRIQKYMKESEIEINIMKYENAESLLKSEEMFDVYFLDIEMASMDGLELATMLRKRYGFAFDIMFVTTKELAVYDAFSVDAMGFIRKSCFDTDFSKTMKRYIDKIKRKNYKYEFFAKNMLIYKSEDEIIFAEVYGHQLILHCEDGEYEMRGTIADLTAKFSKENFVEPHRGYLVNCKFIDHIENDVLILDNSTRIPLSKRKREEVRKAFLHYIS